MITSGWGKGVAAVLTVWAAMAGAARAQGFNTLADFDGANGSSPFYGSLIQGRNGHFYGSTEHGGVDVCSFSNGCGTVFEISPSGPFKSHYSFCPPAGCTTGDLPLAGLLLGTDGSFYGTAWYGGTSGYPCGGSLGCGVIYKIAKGMLSTFYSFCAQPNCADGGFPYGALIEGVDGNLYGTTSAYGPYFGGTVFKITPSGSLTVLYGFCQQQAGCLDGEYPNAGVIQGRDGNFYGTTYYGGANGWGTVYKLTPGGALTTLHSFAGTPTEGGYPSAGLVQGADGILYGTTLHGGNSNCFEGCGTVFKITSTGVFTPLHTFAGPEGDDPYAPLIQATDGEFYGTTGGGGNYGGGTIFKISSAGALQPLYSFCAQANCTDGAGPWGGLLQATNGIFYGTTSAGGSVSCTGCGTVFSLNVGLSPFVAFVRAGAKVGQAVEMLGQGFTGTTNVSVNKISATFTVVSDTFLKVTIPAGATSGYVTVTTPGGTLTSNVPLHVRP